MQDLSLLEPDPIPYQVSEAEITTRLPDVINFTQLAMQQPNHYLWGNGAKLRLFGLMQAVFVSVGIC